MKNTLSPAKINEITYAIEALWIYQNKGIDQARKEVLSRYTPEEVAGYLEAERADDASNAAASDTKGTY